MNEIKKEYKGKFYRGKNVPFQKYEHGAHFSYFELVSRLLLLKKERKMKEAISLADFSHEKLDSNRSAKKDSGINFNFLHFNYYRPEKILFKEKQKRGKINLCLPVLNSTIKDNKHYPYIDSFGNGNKSKLLIEIKKKNKSLSKYSNLKSRNTSNFHGYSNFNPKMIYQNFNEKSKVKISLKKINV